MTELILKASATQWISRVSKWMFHKMLPPAPAANTLNDYAGSSLHWKKCIDLVIDQHRYLGSKIYYAGISQKLCVERE